MIKNLLVLLAFAHTTYAWFCDRFPFLCTHNDEYGEGASRSWRTRRAEAEDEEVWKRSFGRSWDASRRAEDLYLQSIRPETGFNPLQTRTTGRKTELAWWNTPEVEIDGPPREIRHLWRRAEEGPADSRRAEVALNTIVDQDFNGHFNSMGSLSRRAEEYGLPELKHDEYPIYGKYPKIGFQDSMGSLMRRAEAHQDNLWKNKYGYGNIYDYGVDVRTLQRRAEAHKDDLYKDYLWKNKYGYGNIYDYGVGDRTLQRREELGGSPIRRAEEYLYGLPGYHPNNYSRTLKRREEADDVAMRLNRSLLGKDDLVLFAANLKRRQED